MQGTICEKCFSVHSSFRAPAFRDIHYVHTDSPFENQLHTFSTNCLHAAAAYRVHPVDNKKAAKAALMNCDNIIIVIKDEKSANGR